MKLFSLAKESGDLNVDEAIDIVNKQDSTNPLDMQQVKSYQEELEELEKAEQDNQDDSGDATDSEAQTPDNNSGESTDNVEQESTGDETVGDIVDQPEDNLANSYINKGFFPVNISLSTSRIADKNWKSNFFKIS